MGKIFTRYGDGTPVELSEKEFMEDLVARAQMTKGMRIQEAKNYVADKLSISNAELTDSVIMTEVREDLQIGMMTPLPECAKGIEAKFNISRVLDIDINCVNRFKKRTSM